MTEIKSIATTHSLHERKITITVSVDVVLNSPTYGQSKVTLDATAFNNHEIAQILSTLTTNKIMEIYEEAIKMKTAIANAAKKIN